MSSQEASLIRASVDYHADGRQTGVLRLPYSHDRSAYGSIPIPVMVLKNGAGPTVLLTGGNHGDEFEGPVALMDLVRDIDLENVRGRIIVVPALNFPACLAGSRTSPIDGGNLNRSFPGKRDGTPTQILAHYIDTVLFALADYAFDCHSGGASLDYLPILFASRPADPEKKAVQDGLVEAFGAPLMMYVNGFEEDRMMSAAAAKRNVLLLFGEFGGGASANASGVEIVKHGVRRFLDRLGVAKFPALEAPAISRKLRFASEELYLFAPRDGLFVRSFELGDQVRAGDVAGRLYDLNAPWLEPECIRFRSAGLAVCLRTFAKVAAGDCLGHLAVDASA